MMCGILLLFLCDVYMYQCLDVTSYDIVVSPYFIDVFSYFIDA